MKINATSMPATDMYEVVLSALDQAIVAVVLINEHDRVCYFNQAAEQLWGYTRNEVLGEQVEMLVPQAIRAVHSGYTRKNREGGKPKFVGMSRNIPLERRDGQRLWAAFSLSKVDLAGRIHYMAFVRDVSDEVAKSEENRLLLLAVNHTERPIIVLNRERCIVQVNRAFSLLLGYEANEVLGQLPSCFFSPQMDAEMLERLRRNAWHKFEFNEEIPVLCKNGREVWVKASVNSVFDESGGQLQNQVVVLSDVTEERQLRALERDVLEALTSNLSFEALGHFLCQRIESIIPEVLVSLCRVTERKLRPWAAPSFHASYSHDWDGVEIGEGVASCGTCAHRGEAVMVADIATDLLWAAYKHLILPFGYSACWTYPIKRRDGLVIGTFAFYFRQGGQLNEQLQRLVEVSVHLCALAIERESNRQQLTRLVHYDMVTGLPNRSYLYQYIDDLLADSAVSEHVFLHLSLDRFKDINNTLGHNVGDHALLEMSSRLQRYLNNEHFLARPEGNSFVLVMSNCSTHRAAHIAERLRQLVKEPITLSGLSLELSASVGISCAQEGNRGRDELLQSAKNALEQAKAAGGDRYLFFNSGMNELARKRLLLGGALRQAIAKQGLRLEYQPQVRPGSGALYGVEALARWHDAEFGEVPPGQFIGLAEEIGEIEAIGLWALREACQQMAAWREQAVWVPTVSVNLSPLSFRNKDLPAFVAKLLHEFGIAGECLTIEITESAAMELKPDMLNVVYALQALGVGLSVDDFGTGFSSLSNLANLPVTEVKIDRSFIDKCLQDSRLQALVKAVISIGQSLNLTVVAEGVETAAQREFLKQLRCPVAQGYLFSRPIKAQDVPLWMKQQGQ